MLFHLGTFGIKFIKQLLTGDFSWCFLLNNFFVGYFFQIIALRHNRRFIITILCD